MNLDTLSGVHTAMATPMDDQGEIAWADLEKLVHRQIGDGINGLVAVGTTGESPTLNHEEHMQVVRKTVELAAGRVPVMAGTGSNSTREAESLTKQADEAGADSLLLVAPYYNKPTQEGLLNHFSRIAEVTKKPIVLYSIPGRCIIDIGIETVARLHERYPHICAIKEAGGTPERVSQLKQVMGEDFVIISGDDSQTLPFMSVGAKGVISVASNVVVKDLVEMVKLANANDFRAARAIHERYYTLFGTLFIESSPAPVKHALQLMGHFSTNKVRAPLASMSEENKPALEAVLKHLNLI